MWDVLLLNAWVRTTLEFTLQLIQLLSLSWFEKDEKAIQFILKWVT